MPWYIVGRVVDAVGLAGEQDSHDCDEGVDDDSGRVQEDGFNGEGGFRG